MIVVMFKLFYPVRPFGGWLQMFFFLPSRDSETLSETGRNQNAVYYRHI